MCDFDTIDKYVEQDLFTQTVDPINGQRALPWIRDGQNEHCEARERSRAIYEAQLNALYPLVTATTPSKSALYTPTVDEVEKLPKFSGCQTGPYRYEAGEFLWRGASRKVMEDVRGNGTLPIVMQAHRYWGFQQFDKDKGQVEREQYSRDSSRIFDKSGVPDYGKIC
jgi:hypothetical protein